MSEEILGDRFDYLEFMNKSSIFEASEKGVEMGSNDNENSYFPGLGIFQEHEDIADQDLLSSVYHQEELRHVSAQDDLYLDIVSPPFQALGGDIMPLSSEEPQNPQHIESDELKSIFAFPSASLEMLKSYRSRLAKKIDGQFCDSKQWPTSSSLLSTNHIIKLAAGNFIRSNSATPTEISAISHPYASSFLDLSMENAKDVQLVQDLMKCAEEVGNQQYICAGKLLEECHKQCSEKTSSVQRLVYYFTEALHEKIERETGRFTGKSKFSIDTISTLAVVSMHGKMPITQVTQFACVQAMVDHVSTSRKVHIIDLQIWCGIKLIVLMQALASRSECPLEHLKVTTVATTSKSEEVHLYLKSMAESLKLGFSFHVVMLEDVLNNQKSPFHLDPEEAVVLHATHFMQTMISRPRQLERLIRAVEDTKPRAMIIIESESNISSPVFVDRFVEALLFYGAYFDCLNDCMKNAAADRSEVESNILSPAIRNVVAAEGDDRNIRTVGINIWKKFFSQLGMVEMELSKPAISHANLTRERTNCGDSCTLGLNEKSLIIGWKGTPLCSLSAWRFHGKRRLTKKIRT